MTGVTCFNYNYDKNINVDHKVKHKMEWKEEWNSRDLYTDYIHYLQTSLNDQEELEKCLTVHDIYYEVVLKPILLALYLSNYMFES